MPGRARCLIPEIPCQVTQRAVDRRETFSAQEDRQTYLRLLSENLVKRTGGGSWHGAS